MTGRSLNLNALLPVGAVSACTGAAAAALRNDNTAVSSVDWAKVAGAIGAKIEEMFDVPLIGPMADAWRDYEDLAAAANRDAGAPAKLLTVPLINHALDASFEPYLEIRVSGLPAARVDFEIVVEIEFERLELTTQRRAIRAVHIGACRAVVTVKCAGLVLFEHSSPELEFADEIVVPQKAAIDPPPAAAYATAD